jgi:gp16 family phage-associated protein
MEKVSPEKPAHLPVSMKQLSTGLRAALSLNGLSVRAWAIKKQFRVKTVYSALNGRFSGKRDGKAKAILEAAKAEVRKADFSRLGLD